MLLQVHGWANPARGAENVATHKYFASAQAYCTVLEPSDLIFIPSKWSHQVVSLDDTLSITSNYIDDFNIKVRSQACEPPKLRVAGS